MSEQFIYLSLGAGVQSTALLVLSARGLYDCPQADIAVFADTGDEPRWVYEHLSRLEAWSPIPIHRVQKVWVDGTVGGLSADFLRRQRTGRGRFAAIPFFTAGRTDGMLRRQCTKEYKIEPIQQFVRQYLGYKRRLRVRHQVTALMGISVDEALRMKPSRQRWITNRYPLVDAGLTRRNCEQIIAAEGLPAPQKSSCVFCPYHSDEYWKDIKEEHPEEFARAVAFDEAIRDLKLRGVADAVYIHRSRQPLATVDFDPQRDQVDMFVSECEGMCGV